MFYKLKELIFKNKTTRQAIAKNVFWLGVGQFGSRFIRAAITIYSARILGASEYGIFSYVLGVSSFFLIFSDIGISSILSREVAKKPQEKEKYFATIFIIKTILLLLTAILLVVVAPLFIKIEKAASFMVFVALLTILDGFCGLAFSFFKGKEKMELEAIVLLVMNIAITIFGFVVLYFSPTSLMLLKVYIIGSLIGFLMTIYFLRKEYFSIMKNFSKKLIVPVVKAAWPIAIGGLVGAFMTNVDILMMGWWRSAAEIGFYSAAQKIVGMLYIIGGLLVSAVSPALYRFVYENNSEKIRAIMTKIMAIILLIAMPLMVGGIILSKQIIELVFGSDYLNAVPIFIVLISSLLIIYPFSILNNMIFAYNKQSKMVGYSIAATLTNIILNVALIPLYGAIGAAVATVFANFLNVFFMWRFIKKINNFTILTDIKKIIIAVIGMGFMATLLQYSGIIVIINVIISGSFYFILLRVLKDKNFNELLSLIKI